MAERIRLAICRDQLSGALDDLDRHRAALTDFSVPVGPFWRAQDRCYFWNLAARMLAK